MNMRHSVAILLMLWSCGFAQAQSLDVPLEKLAGQKPGTMMTRHWLEEAQRAFQRWQAQYEGRTKPEQIAAYQQSLREKFLAAIGGLPERTPLNPQVTGTVARDGYHVEKILFQSQPKHFVSALLFLPDVVRFQPPYPGVVIPCGHSQNGKGYDSYQSMGALLALSGMAALVFDPIDQGERGQLLGENGWPKLSGTRAHSMFGVEATLLSRNTARFEIWDGMRAIDYLQSRPEVDPKRIGCTGNSGGGTQTSYLMALDDRIVAAAPSCYLCGFPALLSTIGPQDGEQNIFGQIAFGMDHADYVMMRAPTPILMCVATKDFFDIQGAWQVFRSAKRLYTRLGWAERVALLENDAPHNYNELQRQGAARWLSRWLLKNDQPLTEPPVKLLSEEEYECAPSGLVMTLPGARSIYDLNDEYERQLAPRRAAAWNSGDRGELLDQVRRLAGIRTLAELPRPEVQAAGSVDAHDGKIEKLVFELEGGILLPALKFLPERPQAGRVVLYLHEDGKAADAQTNGPIQQLVAQGDCVLAVDLPGTGQTLSGAEGKDTFMAYLLGRSYVGLRAEAILACARYAKEELKADGGVALVAYGHVGIPALHAAALEPELFRSVQLTRTLSSWASVLRARRTATPLSCVVHGALASYDLPNLAETLGRKLAVEEPLEGSQEPATKADAAGKASSRKQGMSNKKGAKAKTK